MANFEYNIGDIIVGTVKEIRPYGAIISFNDEFEGLLHISEISDRYVSDINYFCEVNKNIAIKIIDINEFNNFMRLSLKKVPVNQRLPGPKRKKMKENIKLEEIDFTPLAEALPRWIEEFKKRKEEND